MHIDCTSLMFGVSSSRDTMGTICRASWLEQSASKDTGESDTHLLVFCFLLKELILHRHAK